MYFIHFLFCACIHFINFKQNTLTYKTTKLVFIPNIFYELHLHP